MSWIASSLGTGLTKAVSPLDIFFLHCIKFRHRFDLSCIFKKLDVFFSALHQVYPSRNFASEDWFKWFCQKKISDWQSRFYECWYRILYQKDFASTDFASQDFTNFASLEDEWFYEFCQPERFYEFCQIERFFKWFCKFDFTNDLTVQNFRKILPAKILRMPARKVNNFASQRYFTNLTERCFKWFRQLPAKTDFPRTNFARLYQKDFVSERFWSREILGMILPAPNFAGLRNLTTGNCLSSNWFLTARIYQKN